ncbi:DUF3575 domain-containing protein [Chryseobacterium oryctis]|uniref:DUF3575 domain-containing protein n=1 Tax=Chryseobacterium oryctis TaxID=2952618 RepID=A0ABT3HIZ3_9FLAO|nr:DUF3575 domain-containing protein [Chryseobacterium oryctis]MCW3159750.1 DUF3575 domain-containing protein [Chryseobacterium oryctis]
MKYKFLTSFLTLLSLGTLTAQEQELEKQETNTFIKGNALLIPIGVVNVGIEHQLSKKYTLQGDILISPWKSFAGHPLQYYSASVEGRYYFDEAFKHWYLGANLSFAVFNVQKWNYWKSGYYENEATKELFEYSNIYQKGFSILVGVTAGYQFKLSENWNMDIYATIGSSQGFYKGYDRTTGKRYDTDGKSTGWNKSGEILPYRGGIMISYKFK